MANLLSFLVTFLDVELKYIINSKFIKFGSFFVIIYAVYELICDVIFIASDMKSPEVMERLIMLFTWNQVLIGVEPLLLKTKRFYQVSEMIKYDLRRTERKSQHEDVVRLKTRNAAFCFVLLAYVLMVSVSFYPFNRDDDAGVAHLFINFPIPRLPGAHKIFWLGFCGATMICVIFMESYTYLIIYLETIITAECIILNENLRNISVGYEYLGYVEMRKCPFYQRRVYKRLKRCIYQYSKIMKIMERMNNIFYYGIPIYLSNGSAFCVFLLYYTYMQGMIQRRIPHFIMTLALETATLIDVGLGQSITDQKQTSSISETLYCKTPWYAWNVKNRKAMLMFLLNSQKGTNVKATGVAAVNFNLLIWFFKTIYTSVMVLRQLQV